MTLAEAREEKEVLKLAIQKLIINFSLKTELRVESINVDNYRLERTFANTPEKDIDFIDIEVML